MRVVGSLIDRGVAVVSGSPKRRHAFIAIRDVAQFMVNCLDHEEAVDRIYDIGGPEILTWREVADIYGRIVGRSVRILRVPAPLSHVLYRVATPFSPATANMLGFYWLLTTSDTLFRHGRARRALWGPTDAGGGLVEGKGRAATNRRCSPPAWWRRASRRSDRRHRP